MKVVRDGLYGNFIPLRDAVSAICVGVSVSVEEIDSRRGLNRHSEDDTFATAVERASIGRMLRQARAAEKLLVLLNRSAESRPKWYDSASGYAILDDDAGREGLEILVGWANQMLPSSSKQHGKWNPPLPSSTESSASDRRMAQLGFDVDELIRFLDAEETAHDLGAPLNPARVDQAAVHAVKVAPQPNPEMPEFRGWLAPVLRQAWTLASVPRTTRSMFEALAELARRNPPPKPLLGFSDGEVKFENEDNPEVIDFFSLEKMRSRMRSVNKAPRAPSVEDEREQS